MREQRDELVALPVYVPYDIDIDLDSPLFIDAARDLALLSVITRRRRLKFQHREFLLRQPLNLPADPQ